MITLRAKGRATDGIACKVDTGRALVEAGLHPATGGDGSFVCSHAVRSVNRSRALMRRRWAFDERDVVTSGARSPHRPPHDLSRSAFWQTAARRDAAATPPWRWRSHRRLQATETGAHQPALAMAASGVPRQCQRPSSPLRGPAAQRLYVCAIGLEVATRGSSLEAGHAADGRDHRTQVCRGPVYGSVTRSFVTVSRPYCDWSGASFHPSASEKSARGRQPRAACGGSAPRSRRRTRPGRVSWPTRHP